MAYSTRTEATTYFTGSINEAEWTAITADRQSILLETASRYIDVAFKFRGTQTDEIKAFPRTDLINKCNGQIYLDTDIPQAVKNAEAEIALKMNTSADLSTGTLNGDDFNIKEETVGSLRVVYKDTSSSARSAKPYGYTWLKCLLVSSATISTRINKG